MGKYLLLTSVAVFAIYMWKPDGADPSAPSIPSAFQSQNGSRTGLLDAGQILLTGPGLRNGVLTIHCARDGIAFGFNRGAIIGLNGYSAGMARRGEVVLSDGRRLPIQNTDHSTLARIGIIDTDADPLTYNRRLDQGLELAQKQCGR